MRYKEIIQTVAKEYNTTANEVDKEIRLAIKSAGLQMEPADFIAMVSTLVKSGKCKKVNGE